MNPNNKCKHCQVTKEYHNKDGTCQEFNYGELYNLNTKFTPQFQSSKDSNVMPLIEDKPDDRGHIESSTSGSLKSQAIEKGFNIMKEQSQLDYGRIRNIAGSQSYWYDEKNIKEAFSIIADEMDKKNLHCADCKINYSGICFECNKKEIASLRKELEEARGLVKCGKGMSRRNNDDY